MAKVTETHVANTSAGSNAGFIRLGGVADGYTGSELYIEQYGVQTTDATQTTIAAISLAEDEAIVIEGTIIGAQDDHSEAVGGTFAAVFRRATAGNVTLVGSVDTSVKEDSAAAPTFTLQADTTNQTVDVDVTGVAATTINWVATIRYTKVLNDS